MPSLRPPGWRPEFVPGPGVDRRAFMRRMAASLALAGLAGCDDDDDSADPRDEEVPPARLAAGQAPGQILHYASSALIDGFANGVTVTTRDGRPIKIEGNASHPWSLGGTDVFGQASVLGLYDPFRAQSVRRDARDADWQAFRLAIAPVIARLRASGGEGLRILVGPSTSPTLAAQLAALQAAMPAMRWHAHAAVDRGALYEGAVQAFGQTLETTWQFDGVRTLVSLDADLLDPGPQQVGAARRWARARRALAGRGTLLACHAVASVPSLTQARGEFCAAAPPDAIEAMARRLLAMQDGGEGPELGVEQQRWCDRAGAALARDRGAALVCTGIHASPALHALGHRLNARQGYAGVRFTAPVQLGGDTLAALVEAMAAGAVDTLLIIGANPVYDAPSDLDFAAALARVANRIHAGLDEDETALRCDWQLPLTHPLESWGDARALDGTLSLLQPAIAPMYEGRTATEILSLLFDAQPADALSLLRRRWQAGRSDAAFAPLWEQALAGGVLAEAALPAIQPVLRDAAPSAASAPAAGLRLAFRPDPCLWDGAFADNAWLQELPKPIGKLVWDNALTIAPGFARTHGLSDGDIVALAVAGQTLQGPVMVLAGHDEQTIGLTLGYGRQVGDHLSAGIGVAAAPLRTQRAPWWRGGVTLRRTGGERPLAVTQRLTGMAGDAFARAQPIGAAAAHAPLQASFYPRWQGGQRAWGMVIDLDSCIGCNACVTACVAENNIAVVGREQVLLGREMHWLRVDRYESEPGRGARFMPVPCMHCEQAPCEVGCPVEATLHDREGLNLMVYNRCIGTRACSGYCPYKVRRFNYLDYSAGAAPVLTEQHNPDVTVRANGVMEKCTFCVQRIAAARIDADKGSGVIADGDVRTACQGACPTSAITFGDLAQDGSAVARARADARNYALLEELNTRPRTTYLARLEPPG